MPRYHYKFEFIFLVYAQNYFPYMAPRYFYAGRNFVQLHVHSLYIDPRYHSYNLWLHFARALFLQRTFYRSVEKALIVL
jgi:hypothetical protein